MMTTEVLTVVVLSLAAVACGWRVEREIPDPGLHSNYILVVDAGSTGSRLKVYKFNSKGNQNSLPHVTMESSTKFKPGLSDFVDNLDGLRGYMEGIVNKAKGKVPENVQGSTELMVLATAGLRFFPAAETKGIIRTVSSLLSDPTFSPFVFASGDVQVLSGEEESVYAWIALNYLKGFFHGDKPNSESIGILELGGGSTQIAFIPDGPMYAEEFHVTLAGKLYQLYVQSYLNFGTNGIKREIMNQIKDDRTFQGPSGTLLNPCLLKGDKRAIQKEDGTEVLNEGQGDPQTCKKIMEEIIKPATGIECQPKPCAVGAVYQPRIGNRKFYATGAFTFAPKFLNAVRKDGTLDVQLFEHNAITDYCKNTLAEAVALGEKDEFASGNCIDGLYIPTLFHQSYGFAMDTTQITIGSKVGDKKIDWTLGAVLAEYSSDTIANTRQVQARKSRRNVSRYTRRKLFSKYPTF